MGSWLHQQHTAVRLPGVPPPLECWSTVLASAGSVGELGVEALGSGGAGGGSIRIRGELGVEALGSGGAGGGSIRIRGELGVEALGSGGAGGGSIRIRGS